MVVDDQARAILTRALITGDWRGAIRELQKLEQAQTPAEVKRTGVTRTDVRQVMVSEIQRGKPRRVLLHGTVIDRARVERRRASSAPQSAAERLFAPANG